MTDQPDENGQPPTEEPRITITWPRGFGGGVHIDAKALTPEMVEVGLLQALKYLERELLINRLLRRAQVQGVTIAQRLPPDLRS